LERKLDIYAHFDRDGTFTMTNVETGVSKTQKIPPGMTPEQCIEEYIRSLSEEMGIRVIGVEMYDLGHA